MIPYHIKNVLETVSMKSASFRAILILSVLMIAAAVAMLIYPGTGLAFIALILGASLTLYGLRTLVYYFSMARHMVGGKRILYQGLIVFDLGIFTLTMAYNHTVYVILYLLAIHAFAGVVDVMRAMEARRFDGPWRMDMATGVVNVAIAILAVICGFFLNSMQDIVYIYASGLIYSAVLKIVNALRKTSIIYIQ